MSETRATGAAAAAAALTIAGRRGGKLGGEPGMEPVQEETSDKETFLILASLASLPSVCSVGLFKATSAGRWQARGGKAD